MSLMADPMNVLLDLQSALQSGIKPPMVPVNENYYVMYDEPNGGKRFIYAKVIHGEVQALSIFGLVEPINGIVCWSVGYAVNLKHRGRSLAIEAVEKGIDEMRTGFGRTPMKHFYVEAVVDQTNVYSIIVAEKLFNAPGRPISDNETGTPAFYYNKLISLRR